MLEKQEYELLYQNRETIGKWIDTHSQNIVESIIHSKDADELIRQSAKLNILRVLKTDLTDILENIKNERQ